MNGGIHRDERVAEAIENGVLDGMNVIEDDGDLRRRDAFHMIGASAPFLLPAGSTIIRANGAFNYARVLSLSTAAIGGNNPIDVGALEPFDGVRWGFVTAWPAAPDRHAKMNVSYWNGAAWVLLDEVLDLTTRRITTSDGNVWLVTFCQTGEAHWHRSLMMGWAQGHPDAGGLAPITSRYWVRFGIDVFVNGQVPLRNGTLPGGGGDTLTIVAPGIRAFVRGPAHSVLPIYPNGTPKLLIGSDRIPRGAEGGAQLGVKYESDKPTQEARLIGGQIAQADEGAGTLGVVASPDIHRGAIGEAWPSGTWNTIAGGADEGVAGTLRRNQRSDVPYDWITDQFKGATYMQDVAPVAASISQTAGQLRGQFDILLSPKQIAALPTAPRGSGNDLKVLEGWRLRCTLNPAGGTIVNEEREIVRVTQVGANPLARITIEYHQHFSVAPNTSNRFDVLRPHSRLRITDSEFDYEIAANAVETAAPTNSANQPYEPVLQAADSDKFVHWQIGRPLHYDNRSGDFWDATFDTTTRKYLMTNGKSTPIEYDGRFFRRLRALFDSDNARVQLWVGSLPDDVRNQLRAHEIAGSKLRQKPPIGKFISTWFGHTVISGLQGRPYDIAYSAPSPNNDIWPLLYQTQIRDSFNQPISGMRPLRDRLVVFTPLSVHGLFPPNDTGLLQLEPIAMGVGFVTQRAVAHVGMDTLVGAAADGVYMLNGNEMTPLLEEWEHLVEGGANRSQLHRAVASYSFQRNEYVIAFPGRGSSVNDTIGVLNLLQRKWWCWSAPWGGVADISVVRAKDGTERMLFGMQDGTIAALRQGATDDGEVITGRARSPLHQIDTKRYRLEQLTLYAKELSPTQSLVVRHYLDGISTPFAAPARAVKHGQTGQDYLDVSTLTTMRLAYDRWISCPYPIKEGAEASSYAYEVEGTAQWRIRGADVLLGELPGVHPSSR